ncbi:MAG TPA: YbaB/EbfC family nucleoid-associated protein, partial [Candidatus Bathyarchaeia archaeon]|nr:YbaB/EbfC family nucleoid-associated protein [Candidatus Bathyarchaeia archaeon]
MFDQMKNLMEMKKQADRLKKQLDGIVLDVQEVAGISIQITGSQQFRAIEIAPDLLQADQKERLQRDLLRSVNAAIKKSQTSAAQQMASAM